VDWATQVSQIKESWPEALAEQARSLDQGALVEQLTSQDQMGQQMSKQMLRTVPFFEQMKREPVTVSLKRIGYSWSK
jgi:hypothetical protein